MYLKHLEITGFKSFPTKTTLEFPTGVTSVVGPNGSGKSNVADALRWVLGEQSMSLLRSKKGEDLIFNGTPQRARASKASVVLTIDNRDKIFPFDFNEVTISRKVYRDGINNYYINNSEVRLKDIAELIAHAKLGLKGYTIINQGMTDLILNASPKERREIFEEALGLKEFQLKKKDALNKLSETSNNLKQAKDLMREIEPHLKFLKRQVSKLEKRNDVLDKLKKLESKYFSVRFNQIRAQKESVVVKEKKIDQMITEGEKSFKELEEKLFSEEEKLNKFFENLGSGNERVLKFENRRSQIEREVGKLEGLIELAQKQASHVSIDVAYIQKELEKITNVVQKLLTSEESKIKIGLEAVLNDIQNLFSEIKLGQVTKNENPDLENWNKKRETLNKELKEIDQKLEIIKKDLQTFHLTDQKERERLTGLRNELRHKEKELEELRFKHHDLGVEKNKVLIDEGELKQFFGSEFGVLLKELIQESEIPNEDINELRKQIERIRVRLEVVADIDPETIKEFEQTEERYEFLKSQSEDLKYSITDLEKIIAELDTNIENTFSNAFSKISENFNKYFNLIFGGGKATLNIQKPIIRDPSRHLDILPEVGVPTMASEKPEAKNQNIEESGNSKITDEVGGININVSLPGKKISGLNMLSGGERALTSIAIIFALVSTSPPPFMVLDEIDAALDESNSTRFVKILQDLKKNTQFILVTHNRAVMQEADVLYGVTMEQEGISKLLSLKLEKAEKLTA
jgi:chromosome segregation protein